MGGRKAGIAVAIVVALVQQAQAAGPYLTARAAVVMDAATGEVVWERNGSDPLPPASTTKVLPAILPVESTGIQWVSLHSHNRLLSGYTYLVIGKTGYTRPAGRCFVGAATHDGRELIIAILGARDLWSDAKRLFAFGFGAAPDRPQV